MTVYLREIKPSNYDAVAQLICDSTNAWYVAKGHPPIFVHGASSTMLFCDVYESLDPGCCVLAVDGSSEHLMGACFYHPRSTHVSLGIMNVHPDYFGRGVARQLLKHVTDFAAEQGKPVRLVSSAMNLDSFSLYSKAGFQPFATFQDMILTVPPDGIATMVEDETLAGVSLRDAVLNDVESMVKLERTVAGIDRAKDFRYFIENDRGYWHVSVAERDGKIVGFLGSISEPGSSMIGPGVFIDEAVGMACLERELNFRRGSTMVFLVPCSSRKIVDYAYGVGAKNCEIHFAQSLGAWQPVGGVIMPTFMPETG